jgi:hypothetical protein
MSGYEFRVNDDIAVTHLGVYDHGANGLAVSHEVGLWTLNGQLLASATVQAGTVETLTSSFRFQAIPLVHLSEGVEYVVASTTPIGDPIAFSSTYVNPEEVTWIRARTREGDSFHFAGGTNVNRGYFGGNFMFVPEPCTIVLMASGMVALVRRRAKRRS